MKMAIATTMALLLMLTVALADRAGRADAGPAQPRDMSAPPAASLTREISNAWNYNALQRGLLEEQIKRAQAEVARLEAERVDLVARLKSEFQFDVAAGDSFDERTLKITHRRAAP